MKIIQGAKTLTIELETRLKDKRHQAEFKRLLDTDLVDAIQYAKSFNGTKVRVGSIRETRSKIDSIQDSLAIKPKNSIARLYEGMFDAEANHKPLQIGLGDWIGVEIECFIPYRRARSIFDDCEIEIGEGITYCEPGEGCNECGDCDSDCDGHEDLCEGHDNGEPGESEWRQALCSYFESLKIKRVSVKEDGSIDADSGYFPAEITILFLRQNREPLRQLCDALAKLGAEVNRTCGMHVHLDQRGRTMAKVEHRAHALTLALPLLASMVPMSRRRNNYCKLSASLFTGSERYHAINCTAYKKYQTLEVRLHSATRDFDKISNWIDLLLLIQDSDLEDSTLNSVDDLCLAVNVPERLIQYIEARIARFSNENAKEQAGQDTQTAEVAA
jgi:hypothetical protein